MKISSIVVNYRTPGDLSDFLASYDGYEDDELFVVNVAPLRDDVVAAESWSHLPGYQYIEFGDNVGYARAVNRASLKASGDVLAIFNADVILRPNALHLCAEHLCSRDDWGVLGPLQVDDHDRCTHPGIFGTLSRPEWRAKAWQAPVQDSWREIRDDAVTVMGSAYFVKSTVWDELADCPLFQKADPKSEGAFLNTNLYFEETFASYHAIKHGYKVVFDGTVEIVHKWHGSIKQNNVDSWSRREFAESKKVFVRACELHDIEHD